MQIVWYIERVCDCRVVCVPWWARRFSQDEFTQTASGPWTCREFSFPLVVSRRHPIVLYVSSRYPRYPRNLFMITVADWATDETAPYKYNSNRDGNKIQGYQFMHLSRCIETMNYVNSKCSVFINIVRCNRQVIRLESSPIALVIFNVALLEFWLYLSQWVAKLETSRFALVYSA